MKLICRYFALGAHILCRTENVPMPHSDAYSLNRTLTRNDNRWAACCAVTIDVCVREWVFCRLPGFQYAYKELFMMIRYHLIRLIHLACFRGAVIKPNKLVAIFCALASCRALAWDGSYCAFYTMALSAG